MSLRTRLLLSLIATSAITLAALALALLPPLQDRLRTDSRKALESTVYSTRLALQQSLEADAKLPYDDLLGAKSTEILDGLAQRSGARVILLRAPLALPNSTKYDSGAGRTTLDDVYRAWRTGHSYPSKSGSSLRLAVPIPATGPDGTPQWVLAVRQSETQATRAVGVVRRAFVAAAVISLGIATVLGFLLSGTLVRRIVRLRRTALDLADAGSNAPPPPVDSASDEVGDLSRALGSMHAAIQRQEQARRAFVATASHELRTPITSIQGNMEMLAEDLDEGSLDAADARRQVASAQDQLRRLANLATELLDLSRLDAGVELRHEPVDLAEITRAVVAEFVQRAEERGVLIEAEEPRGAVWAGGDPGAVARIVRILLDNGLRFSPKGGLLKLTTEYSGEHAYLSLSDDGPGVPPLEREHIFERFQRGSTTGGEGGFGLGLAIGRELARRMGGELALVPEGLTKGATFSLTLPIQLPE